MTLPPPPQPCCELPVAGLELLGRVWEGGCGIPSHLSPLVTTNEGCLGG